MECWVGEEMSESETHQGQRVGRAVRVPDKAESRRGCSGVRTTTSCDRRWKGLSLLEHSRHCVGRC